jgi:hypothetical protein
MRLKLLLAEAPPERISLSIVDGPKIKLKHFDLIETAVLETPVGALEYRSLSADLRRARRAQLGHLARGRPRFPDGPHSTRRKRLRDGDSVAECCCWRAGRLRVGALTSQA